MGCRVIEGKIGDRECAVFYCSTTEWAFGPIFADVDQAEAFIKWLAPIDPRNLENRELESRYSDFIVLPEETRLRLLEPSLDEDGE